MKKETTWAALALLIIVVTGLRLMLALSDPSLAYEGYREIRLLDHLAEQGTPLLQDELSYGGRERAYSPLYHYLLLPFTYFLDTSLVLKILPNILFAFTILFVYFIAYDITRERTASLLSATLAGFTPIIFSSFINDANNNTLAVPLFLIAIYALIQPKKRFALLIISTLLLAVASSSIFLFLLGIIFFVTIAAIENIRIKETHFELLFFLFFFSLWIHLLIYKEAFLQKGLSAVWGYLPTVTYVQEFTALTIPLAVGFIGVLPLLFASYAAYHALSVQRSRAAILTMGMTASVLLIMVLGIMSFTAGVFYLTLLLCILASQGFASLFSYIKKTKAPQIRYFIIIIMLFFFLLSSVFPAFTEAVRNSSDIPSEEEFALARWVTAETADNAKVLASPKEGFFLAKQTGKKVFLDEEYLLINNVDSLLQDAEQIYRARFALPALELLQKHDITHVIISSPVRSTYGIEDLSYVPNNCFDLVYNQDGNKIYEVTCDVTTR